MENQQNEILNIKGKHSLDEAFRLASIFPNNETPKTEDVFDIDRESA